MSDLNQPNEEQSTKIEIELATIENEDTRSIYHEIFQPSNPHKFLLSMTVMKKFLSDYSSKSSKKFEMLAANLEDELREIFPNVAFSLQSVLQAGLMRRRISVTFACESEMNVDEFEKSLRNFIFTGDRLRSTKVKFFSLKCREVNEEEFEHFKKYGFECCESCALLLQFRPTQSTTSSKFILVSLTILSIILWLLFVLILLTQHMTHTP